MYLGIQSTHFLYSSGLAEHVFVYAFGPAERGFVFGFGHTEHALSPRGRQRRIVSAANMYTQIHNNNAKLILDC